LSEEPPRSIRIVDADKVDPPLLSAFLDEAIGPVMRGFLSLHSDWWHRGRGHRWAALCDETVAGYRAFIPTLILLDGRELPAAWGFDLFVLPRFRGLGLQKLLDERLTDASDLVISFPSDVGAKVYAKQGHGIRDDVPFYQMSLAPRPLTQAAPGTSGVLRHVAGRSRELGVRGTARQALIRARTLVLRAQSSRYRPTRTARVDSPDPQALEELFLRYVDRGVVTTLRSADFLRWRYLDAPYRSDLVFYLRGSTDREAQCAIVRYVRPAREARILDVFGDLTDEDALADLVHTVLREAVRQDIDRVTVLGSSPEIVRALRKAGFTIQVVRPFRWSARDPRLHERFSTVPLRWTLGDSCLDRRE
jgi:GNAT superfamily N-acetyltransferase